MYKSIKTTNNVKVTESLTNLCFDIMTVKRCRSATG